MIRGRQYLIFDADDTLWENNIHFEAAFDDFVAVLDHEHLTAAEIQAVVDELELETRRTHGYGARAFARSLRRAFQLLTGLPDGHPDLDEAERLGLQVLDAPFQLLPDVISTLDALRPHHALYLLTKGHEAEQQAKIDRSGLVGHFDASVITAEKHPDTYRELMAAQRLPAEATWMIGNSPRSDINPALAAGINAVYLPHPRTWHLELEALFGAPEPGRQLIEIASIGELLDIFER